MDRKSHNTITRTIKEFDQIVTDKIGYVEYFLIIKTKTNYVSLISKEIGIKKPKIICPTEEIQQVLTKDLVIYVVSMGINIITKIYNNDEILLYANFYPKQYLRNAIK